MQVIGPEGEEADGNTEDDEKEPEKAYEEIIAETEESKKEGEAHETSHFRAIHFGNKKDFGRLIPNNKAVGTQVILFPDSLILFWLYFDSIFPIFFLTYLLK